MAKTNHERLLDLLHDREEFIPLIHDSLAEHHISDDSYAQIFRLIHFSMADSPENEVAFCKGTKEWRRGKRPLSDAKLFVLLNQVCDIVRYYVLSSWDECIFSAWTSDSKEVLKVEREMETMEGLAQLRAILKGAAEMMVYNSDGAIDWSTAAGDDSGISDAPPVP